MKLTISLAQVSVTAARPAENLKKSETFIQEAALRKSDIICFPEMWTTGFNWEYNKKAAYEHEETVDRVADMARRYSIWINGSLFTLNEDGRLLNTSILFDPKGKKAGAYSKTHLFSLVNEDKHVAPGESLGIVDTPWGLVGLSVCYDIRFPELFRSYALKGVGIVFSPMAFPYPRLQHWKVLVRARAIENQMFMVGTNQVGTEDLGKAGILTYCGDSVIIDPWGDTVAEAGEKVERLVTATIDTDRVGEIRNKMMVLQDRRPDLYELGGRLK